MPDARTSEPRERLLRTAAGLFYREGITGVGVDRVLAEAGVTRATMYATSPARRRSSSPTSSSRTRRSAATSPRPRPRGAPRELLDLVIDGVADDAARYHDRGCPFINASAEYADPDSPVRAVVRTPPRLVPGDAEQLDPAAGLPDPERPPRPSCCCGTPRWWAPTSTARTPSVRPSGRPPGFVAGPRQTQ